ncbi:MAG: HEAT repeat domain-containing protein, partial [Leptolyngbya sp. LCM1.Bin17]
DETTRALLTQRAVEDENEPPRRAALGALADKWPDETTRALLTQRAVEDENESPRRAALEALADKWPDETTRDFFAQRTVQDPAAAPRGAAWIALGKLHSEFGRMLPTRDLDGVGPYLDPLEPILRDHIEKAAQKAGIPAEDIDAQVAALSAHCGWDITVGARPANNGSAE